MLATEIQCLPVIAQSFVGYMNGALRRAKKTVASVRLIPLWQQRLD
jgi:hypothetical protein